MTKKPFLCKLGFHSWRDVWRENETFCQRAVEKCIKCHRIQKYTSLRFLWKKTKEPLYHEAIKQIKECNEEKGRGR